MVSCKKSLVLQTEEAGGDQLPLCAQKASRQAGGSGPYSGNHATSARAGTLPSCLHGRRDPPEACVHLSLLASFVEPQEVDRVPLLAAQQEHDDGPYYQTLQAAGPATDARLSRAATSRCGQRSSPPAGLPEHVRPGSHLHTGRVPALVYAARRNCQQLRC